MSRQTTVVLLVFVAVGLVGVLTGVLTGRALAGDARGIPRQLALTAAGSGSGRVPSSTQETGSVPHSFPGEVTSALRREGLPVMSTGPSKVPSHGLEAQSRPLFPAGASISRLAISLVDSGAPPTVAQVSRQVSSSFTLPVP